jgi:hypothetical protein
MPRPVYWKPTYATRRMRERIWAKRSLERERALALERARAKAQRPSLFERVRRLFRCPN